MARVTDTVSGLTDLYSNTTVTTMYIFISVSGT